MHLFFIMVIVTAIEVVLISKVGSLIGFWMTFLLIIFTAVIGSSQLKRQWAFVMGKLQSLQSEPSEALLEALVLLICGVLLITPGFLTDIVGFLGLAPRVRERLVAVIRKKTGKVIKTQFYASSQPHDSQAENTQQSASQSNSQQNRKDSGNIIEGEFERKDE